MRALLLVIYEALDLYKWVVIGAAVLSWLIAFNVVNIRNDVVRSVWNVLDALTTPLLRPIRNFLPNLGGIDISPVILLLAHQLRPIPYRRLAESLPLRVLTRREPSLERRGGDGTPRSARMPQSQSPKTGAGRFFEDFARRAGSRPRDAAHRQPRRRRALFGALRRALRGASRPNLRPTRSAIPAARSTTCCLPCRVRQDRRRRLAQRGRQSRLCRRPLPRTRSIPATR